MSHQPTDGAHNPPSRASSQLGMADAGSSRDASSGAHSSGAAADEAALDRLVERALTAEKSTRHAFAASLWKRAAAAATALHGGESLAAVRCTLEQAASLCTQYGLKASNGSCIDTKALFPESWALVSSVLPLLSARMDDNTLLPGRCTKEEVEFFKRYTMAKRASNNYPPLSARELQLTGFGVGYATLIAAYQVLVHFKCEPRPPLAALEFVLRAVDMVRPARHAKLLKAAKFDFTNKFLLFVDAASFAQLASDHFGRGTSVRVFLSHFAFISSNSFMCRFADSCVKIIGRPSDPFIDALRERWMAPALMAMRAERPLADISAEFEAASKRLEAARRADIAAHGLKHCAFPSCDKQEATVQQYKFCSACRSVWYCSAEHGALHWREHKPTCRATVAAKEAAAGEGAACD